MPTVLWVLFGSATTLRAIGPLSPGIENLLVLSYRKEPQIVQPQGHRRTACVGLCSRNLRRQTDGGSVCRSSLIEAHQSQYRDVVFLPERARGFHNLFHRRIGCGEGGDALKSIQLTGFVLRLDNAVGVEGEGVVLAKVETGFLVFRVGCESERQGPGDRQFGRVVEGREMSGIGQRHGAVWIDTRGDAGGEAAVGSAYQPAVEPGKNFRRALGVIGERSQAAYDERNR